MAITAEDFYRSSNGDRWQLIRPPHTGGWQALHLSDSASWASALTTAA